MIYTVGYQSYTLKQVEDIAKQKDVSLIIDVRSVPYSRKTEFNRKNLEKVFGEKYRWYGRVLGGKYGPATPTGMKTLKYCADRGNVLVLCMESHPCDCHRYYDIGLRLQRAGYEATHLFEGRELTTAALKEVCDERKQ